MSLISANVSNFNVIRIGGSFNESSSRSHGRVQVPAGDLAQEAVRHCPLPAARALLGVPSAAGHPPRLAPVAA